MSALSSMEESARALRPGAIYVEMEKVADTTLTQQFDHFASLM